MTAELSKNTLKVKKKKKTKETKRKKNPSLNRVKSEKHSSRKLPMLEC